MDKEVRILRPGPGNTLIDEHGVTIVPPNDWSFLPAGDAGLTRKVTSKGVFWRVQVQKGRRAISKGIWAPTDTIAHAKSEIETLRNSESYQKKLAYSRNRSTEQQKKYEKEFFEAIVSFLNFSPQHKDLEIKMAELVTKHAIPVGSGTVARTSMIPIRERASRAVIAWMRHHTTAYDNLKIQRIKGARRAIRRMYAQQSSEVLEQYRNGYTPSSSCPLKTAIIRQYNLLKS
ncbi:DUF2293 domain-containing protein [Puteibacter caeruleilacunae]|nr:DUF2293 domain-containing protein [Puteibacter caeruleilacunae]